MVLAELPGAPDDRGASSTIAEKLSRLSPRQRAALELRLLNRTAAGAPSLPRQPRTAATFPLSSAQQHLWFLDQLEEVGAAYHLATGLHFQGPLDLAALKEAFAEVVRRHESLRTIFVEVDGEPRQRILPNFSPAVPVVDLGVLPDAQREEGARELAAREAARAFCLAEGPLVRLLVVRLGDQDHLVLATQHHIVSDAWSIQIFLRELQTLYAAVVAGQPPVLPEVPIQYVDFAVWQRQRLDGEALQEELAYWRRQLAGVPQRLALPTDRPLPPVRRRIGSSIPVNLGSSLTRAVRGLAGDLGATPFMILLGAFQVLLGRISGLTDICVGVPVSGRNLPEVEGLIGFFVNSLVIRTDLSADPPFRRLAERVRDTVLEALAHQQVPFERLVEELNPERSRQISPLFQVLFSLYEPTRATFRGPGARLVEPHTGFAKFDLSLVLINRDEGFQGILEYDAEIFDAPTIRRLLVHFSMLLEEAVAPGALPISEISLLAAAERHQSVMEWNATQAVFTADCGLHELFAAQVDRTPDAVALVYEGERVSYRELDLRAGALARRLRSLGVGAESLVGVCAQRSVEMVVALLGILKAGAAYVPLDPEYPVERLAFMVEDSGMEVLLASPEALAGPLAGLSAEASESSLRVVPLAASLNLPAVADGFFPSPVHPGQLAYVIYTSGSTGRPKGAMVDHRAIVNRLLWMQSAYSLEPSEAVLQKTPFSFDVSVWELFWPLITGARLVLARSGGQRDGDYLVGLIQRERVTTLHFVPSMLRAFLETPEVEKCCTLRCVICSGEALPPAVVERFEARLHTPLHNLYGPTEAAVDVSFWECRREGLGSSVPIGRPVANTWLYLLDRRLQPVPIGVPGELCIGGVQVARGYLGRPGLTAERFQPDPYARVEGARLYRTGDLASFRPDGNIEFLGRLDHQVKLRGFRIELGEIEAALEAIPGVRETVVVARQDLGPDTQLVAYLVATGPEPPSVSELQAALKERLPGYMVPALFVFLEGLPLTPNGKVDRRALPIPVPDQRYGAAGDPPRSLTEEILAAIWCEILGLERVGIHDNFFERGGHSLTAVRVVSRIRRLLGAEIPVGRIFETPTIAGLAAAVRERTGMLLPPIQAGAGTDEETLPLSFGQQRLWFLHQLEPDNTAYNMTVPTRISGPIDIPALAASFAEIRRRHTVLRMLFPTREGKPAPRIEPPRPEILPVVDLGNLPAGERDGAIRRLLRAEALRPFDLARGPLLRLLLLRLAPDEHLLLLGAHHIVVDDWSFGILLRELEAHYEACLGGRPSPLPELPVQYADFARWQRSLEETVLPHQLDYWRQQLAGAPVLDLATDRPRPRLQSGRGASAVRRLSPALGSSLRQLGTLLGATSFTASLAVFAILLQRMSGQDDIVVGTPVAQRQHEEIEPLIGFFLNLLVLRLDLMGKRSFREHLAQSVQVVLEAQSHLDLPFERLVEELDPERALSQTPLFQVMFTLLNRSSRQAAPAGLSLRSVEGEVTSAKYDLSLVMLTGDQDLIAQLEYSSDLFDATTMERLLQHLEALLAAAVAGPDLPLEELSHLTSGERQQLVHEVCDSAADIPARSTLPALLAASAERRPDAVAVSCDDRSLTYGELWRRSRHLARRLRAAGVTAETPVGLCTERSLDMVVGLWGILAAGGAYLPLDPMFPDDRLAWMIEDSRVPVVLTQRHLRQRLQAYGGAILFLDEAAADSGPTIVSDADGGTEAGQLAYILYTSGSTGRPKGVQITHRSVVNFLASLERLLDFGEDGVWLAVTTLSFDISVLELMLPWMVGGQVVLVGPEISSDGARLAGEIALRKPTAMQATPAGWQLLLFAGWEGAPGLSILSGGEALPPHLARELLQRGCRLWNLFGPTETTVWSTVRELQAGEPALHALRVPVGRAIGNTRVFVCGRSLELKAIGETGELCIGGEGLSRGYLGRPEQTAVRFVPDPFSGEAGARLYWTGDLVRMLGNGEIDVVGRLDHQVKLRGFRIEPGEIERVLEEHAAIREAVALLREDGPGDRRLVAYVVPVVDAPAPPAGGPDDPLLQSLESHLRKRLPAYMVPAHLVRLAALPRTPNGKIDRRALPVPRGLVGAALTAPRTPVEERLAAIWAEVLKLQRVDVEASFFDLGGHSLSATEMMYRVRTTFGVELPLPQLFDTPTVAGLAAAIARSKATSAESLPATEPIVPDARHRFEPFPLNEVQQAYWIGRQGSFDLGNVASHNYTEIDFTGLDLKRLEEAVRRLISRHDMLRAVVLPDGRQQILPEVPPYEIAVQDLRHESPVRTLAALQALRDSMSHEVLPLDRPPLLALKVSLLDGDRARLHFSLDYLIADAWSTGILFREIFRLYREPGLKLPALELSFRDWVLAEERSRGSERHRRAEEHWSRKLGTLPPAPELPLAKDPGDLPQPRFARHSGSLPQERWQALRARAARGGLTPSGLLLAAFSEILAAWSKKPRFTLNLTLFNRPPVHPQIEDIVGDFTVLSLLEVDAGRPGSFELRARALQEELWQNLEHREVSGVWVLRELARAQGKTPNALMPVVFTSTLGQDKRLATESTSEASDGPVYSISQTPQVWLDHQVGETGSGGLSFNWDAVEELFPAGLLDDMFGAYCRLLSALAEEETWQRPSLALLPPAQLALRAAVNATAAPVPEGLLHQPFEQQVRERPAAPAVIAGERTLSYEELDARATSLAWRLRQLGAEPNRLVAVVMEKGWEQIVAVLAILKSGAAYLPVDPALPRQRRDYLLAQGEVKVALTQPWLAAELQGSTGIEWLVVEQTAPAGESRGLAPVQGPGDLAYVIFTSGSTGQPKGVMIDHRGALNTVVDVNQRFAVGAADRVLGLSSLSFDLSVYDVFGTLGAGGALVLPEESARRDPGRWLELMEQHGVTVWNSVPTLLEMLVEYCRSVDEPRSRRALGALRRVLLSGDWIPLTLPVRLRKLAGQAEVISLGGATEASIWSILYPIGELDPSWSSIPYGRPMVNQGFHVLGDRLEPRPEWVPGELYISGIGLALGYWRDEEKTWARFVEHPETGERLYRTGDLGRYRPDGAIEFLGREDFQVKIRGHRIELGEIEASLVQHPAVRAGVVVAVGEPRGERRLVSYVVLQQDDTTPPARNAERGDAPLVRLALGFARWTPPSLPAPDPDRGFSSAADKLAFRLAEPGLRREDEEREQHPLLRPVLDEQVLAAYRRRASHRQFPSTALSQEAFERFLLPLMRVRLDEAPLPKYRYPSAGDLYPVQVYVHVKPGSVAGLDGGTYYYHPRDHVLVALEPGVEIGPEVHAPVNRPIAESAAFSLFLVGRLDAIAPLYEERARDFCLLEAGYMGQLLMEAAPESGIGLCPVGGLDFERVSPFLALDGSHQLLHSFLGGPLPGDGAPATAAELSGGEGEALATVSDREPETVARRTPVPEAEGMQPLITDELARLEFKLGEPGLRHDDMGSSRIGLPRPMLDTGFLAPYRRRRSHRDFRAEPIAAARFGSFLSALAGVQVPETPLPKYRYPSAGSLYPVQVFLHVREERIEGLPTGTYYYHPRAHRLTLLASGAPIGDEIHFEVNRAMAARSAFTLFLVGRPQAIRPLYGEQARDFSLLEAGYMGQLLMTVAPDHGLGLCPVGGVHFDRVAPWLALEAGQELLHAFVVGAVSPVAAENGVASSYPVSPSGEQSRELEEVLAAHLRTLLPEHMVPTAWVFLKNLPLTANGKVDRKALPDVKTPARGSGMPQAAPRSEMERTLVRIWQEVLGKEQVGVHDNLFDLGGTSLDLVRLRNRLQEEVGRDVPLTRFFTDPTVASLAEILSTTEPQERQERMAGAQSAGRKQKEALKQRKELMKKRRSLDE